MPDIAAHPFLFFLVGALGAVELGLTAYQVHLDQTAGFGSQEFKNRLAFLLFVSCWTVFFAIVHWLFWVHLGLLFTILTFIFWTIGAALWHNIEHFSPSDCTGSAVNSVCRRFVAIEAIGWTEVALTALLILALLFFWHSTRGSVGYYRAGGRTLY